MISAADRKRRTIRRSVFSICLGACGALLTACPRSANQIAPSSYGGRLPGLSLAWKEQVTEYRRTYVSGGVLALFRYDRVEGRDAATGRRLWVFKATLFGRPAFHERLGYFGVRRSGTGGPSVGAYDLSTGRRLWATGSLVAGVPRAGFPRPTLGGSRLAADSDVVTALVRGWFPDDASERPPRETECAVVCLDSAGGIRWVTRLPDAAPTEELPLAVFQDRVVTHNGEELLGLDRRTGAVAWRLPSSSALELEALSSTRGLALTRVADGWNLLAFETATGKRAWTSRIAATGQERSLAHSVDTVGLQYERPPVGNLPAAAAVILIDADTGRNARSETIDTDLLKTATWPLGLAFLPGNRLAAGYQAAVPTTWAVYVLDVETGRSIGEHRLADALQEMVVTPSGLLILHESGYGRGFDRLTALTVPRGEE